MVALLMAGRAQRLQVANADPAYIAAQIYAELDMEKAAKVVAKLG